MIFLTRILLLSFAVAVWSASACDETCCVRNWLGYQGSCYRYFTFPKTWQDARDYCLNVGGDLASIHTLEENKIINVLVGGRDTWIGLNDIQTDGTFRWSDGTAPTYLYPWAQGQPDNAGGVENCVQLNWSEELWNNHVCNHLRGFICKK